MEPKQESHLFLYPVSPNPDHGILPACVFIKIPGFGSILCKVDRMDEQEIAAMYEHKNMAVTPS